MMCLCPSCNYNPGGSQSDMPDLSAESLEETIPDTEGPVISGTRDLTASVGGTPSYRTGVAAEDDRDRAVSLLIDSKGG